MPVRLIGTLSAPAASNYTQFDATRAYDWTSSSWFSTLPGDLILINAATTGTAIPDITTPPFVNLFGTITQNSRLNVAFFWKFLQAGETAITVPNIYTASNGGQHVCYVIRGVNLASPFDIPPVRADHVTQGGGGSALNPAAITPVNPGTVVMGFANEWSTNATSSMKWNAPAINHRTFSVLDKDGGNKSFQAVGYFQPWTSGAVDGTISGTIKDSWIIGMFAFRDASVSSGGRVKYWNGATFDQKPVKVWNGSAWVTKPVKFWNGTAWRTMT